MRLALAGFALLATPVDGETVLTAQFAEPTSRYQHGILGDAIEWGELQITTNNVDTGSRQTAAVDRTTDYMFRLPLDSVFEDVAPRLWDVDGDGGVEVVVVETSVHQGAQLAVYDHRGKRAATPYIGQRNRWLAPIGAADLDGDGTMEIAYIDRPHLAKTLRIVSIEGDLLAEEIAGAGFTNHRIGERDIAGGVRDCGNGPEMIVASADWSQLVAVTYDGTALNARQIGTDTTRPGFAAAMACQ